MSLLRRKPDDESLRARVREALVRLRTLLPLDDCAVELVALRDGIAELKVGGACPQCAMDAAALAHGIEAHVRSSVPAVREVRIIRAAPVTHDARGTH